MVPKYKTVEVEVDVALSEFDDDDLICELQERKIYWDTSLTRDEAAYLRGLLEQADVSAAKWINRRELDRKLVKISQGE